MKVEKKNEPECTDESHLCDCEQCKCPKLRGTWEAVPAVCVSCGWGNL